MLKKLILTMLFLTITANFIWAKGSLCGSKAKYWYNNRVTKKIKYLQKLNRNTRLSKKQSILLDKLIQLNRRITARKRFSHILCRLYIPQLKGETINQLGYIRDGFISYGYLPKQNKYYRHRDIPPGFWVYVYPHLYVWKVQDPSR